jgi:plastocyanin
VSVPGWRMKCMENHGIPTRPAFSPRACVLRVAGVVAFLTLAPPCVGAERGGGASPAPGSETGALRGTVIVGPKLNARKIRFSLYPDVSAAAPSRAFSSEQEIRNVVLYLEAAGPSVAGTPGPSGPLRIEQRNESFLPHVLPVMRGSTVEFTNGDPIYHNVFSLSKAASFDLGRYPRGASRSVRFDEPGIVKVFCHIHSDMSAVILVLDTPYFTIPGSGGEYEIAGIPPGTYTATAWHERAHPIHREVTILPGRTAGIDFTIPLEDVPSE